LYICVTKLDHKDPKWNNSYCPFNTRMLKGYFWSSILVLFNYKNYLQKLAIKICKKYGKYLSNVVTQYEKYLLEKLENYKNCLPKITTKITSFTISKKIKIPIEVFNVMLEISFQRLQNEHLKHSILEFI